MAFSGTTVTGGQGQGIVVATGDSTQIGLISGLLSQVDTLTTPLVEQMAGFAKWLTLFILAISGLILTFGFFVLHRDFGELFMAVVGLSVAAIPEGLPAVLTITLAVGVQAMARRHAIVRRLPAIETLGSVSVICSDKTGTLTRNEMSLGKLHGLLIANRSSVYICFLGHVQHALVSWNNLPCTPVDWGAYTNRDQACSLLMSSNDIKRVV